MKGYLVLENGKVFPGKLIGFTKEVTFEIFFNTSMCGYVEALTDPSNIGQGIVFTYPLIGNYGVTKLEMTSKQIQVSAIIVRELADFSNNFQKHCELNDYLIKNKTPGLSEINTRELTKTIRTNGTIKARICKSINDIESIILSIKKEQINNKLEIVATNKIIKIGNSVKPLACVIDLGDSKATVESLLKRGYKVVLFPPSTKAECIFKLKPVLIVLTNGPSNPNNNTVLIKTVSQIYKKPLPMLAVGFGHLVLAIATGLKVIKLKHGHHGSNLAVHDISNKKVIISNQNRNYTIDPQSITSSLITTSFINVNDSSIEGIKYKSKKILSIAFLPELSEYCLEASYLYDNFLKRGKNNA